MKYQRAKAGFIRYADSELLVAVRRILRGMKDSDVFGDATPALSEVETVFAAYEQSVVVAAGGGRMYGAAKRECKRRLANILQELAFYVSVKSDGNLAMLHSSGFPVLEKRGKGKVPGVPGQPYIRDGRISGSVVFGFRPVGRDMTYDYSFATETDKKGRPVWGPVSTTTRSFKNEAEGFVPGEYIYLRIRARNRHGASHWTDPIMFMVR